MKKQVIIIGGPTASGKTSCAIDFASQYNGVIINADSMQIYEELPILTAHPTKYEMESVSHKLYGVTTGNKSLSVAGWQALAIQEINQCHENNKVPIIVGGTGMYLQALLFGLSDVPEIDSAIRQKARSLCAELGSGEFHKLLEEIDPEMAARLSPNDGQRITRAYEVMMTTGKSLAFWQGRRENGCIHTMDVKLFVTNRSKVELEERAKSRLKEMWEENMLEEVKSFMALDYDYDFPIYKAVGLRETIYYLNGECSKQDALVQTEVALAQLIKKQLTWFRRQFKQAESL